MSVLETLFIILVACTLLSTMGIFLYLILFYNTKKSIRSLMNKRFKSRKKNKKITRKKNKLIKKKNKYRYSMIITVICAAIFGGGSLYISYYQSMNLTNNDSDAVVKGYYFLQDFQEQLDIAKNEGDSKDKLEQNIRYLSTAMASYGIQKASTLNSKEGQLVLNRYYISLKQIGMNASTQTTNFYGNPSLVSEFNEDIKRVKEYEKAAFDYFKVDSTVFSENKVEKNGK